MRPKADATSPAVELRVRVRDAEYRPLDNAKVALKITLPGGENLTLDAEPDGREAGTYAATYVTRQPGAYRVVATATAPDGSAVGEREAGWAAQPAADEFARLEPDREFLKTIAAKTNGEVVDGDRLATFRRQPLLTRRPDHRAVDLSPVASAALFPDRHRLPDRRMGPAARQWPGVTSPVDTETQSRPSTGHVNLESGISNLEFGILNSFLLVSLCTIAAAPEDRPCVLIVVGASGTPEYAAEFRQWADQWQAAAAKAGAESIAIGLSDEAGHDRSRPAAVRSWPNSRSRRASRSGSS